MFKTTLATSSLILTVAQAVAFNQSGGALLGESSSTLQLAQTSALNSDCCCQMMPCMPTCVNPCRSEPPVPPPILTEKAPEPIKNVVMNLDVILTHILHEIHPDPEIPEYTPPEPASPDEHEFVQNVLSPIVIQLLNNDVVPAIPTCVFPDGTSAADFGLTDGQVIVGEAEEESSVDMKNLPDPAEVLREVLKASIADMDLPEAVSSDELINKAMPSEEIVKSLNIGSADGRKNVDIIIQGLRQSVTETLNEEVVTGDFYHDYKEKLVNGLEESGIDTEGMEGQIKEVIDSVTSGDKTPELAPAEETVDVDALLAQLGNKSKFNIRKRAKRHH